MAISAAKLVELSMVSDLAVEVAAQMNGGTKSARRLQELGMVGPLAARLVSMMNAGVYDATKLQELGMVGPLAAVIASGGTPTPTPNLFAAIANVKAGTGRATLAIVGDSTQTGLGDSGAGGGGGSNPDTSGNCYRPKCAPVALRQLFTVAGLPSRSDAILGDNYGPNGSVINYTSYNPNVTMAAGWSIDTTFANRTAAGNYFLCTTGTAAMTFTPEETANRFDILYVVETGAGTFTITDASGTLATIDANNTAALGKVTVSRAGSSILPISIQRTGVGGSIKIIGIIPYDTNAPRFEIWNLGYSGAEASNQWLASNLPTSPFNVIGLLNPNAFKFELGLNDSNGSRTPATFKTSMQSLIDKVKVPTIDILLAVPHQARPSSYVIPAGYITALNELAATNAAALVDFYNNVSLILATDFFDTVHLTQAGYAKKEQYEFNTIRSYLGV